MSFFPNSSVPLLPRSREVHIADPEAGLAASGSDNAVYSYGATNLDRGASWERRGQDLYERIEEVLHNEAHDRHHLPRCWRLFNAGFSTTLASVAAHPYLVNAGKGANLLPAWPNTAATVAASIGANVAVTSWYTVLAGTEVLEHVVCSEKAALVSLKALPLGTKQSCVSARSICVGILSLLSASSSMFAEHTHGSPWLFPGLVLLANLGLQIKGSRDLYDAVVVAAQKVLRVPKWHGCAAPDSQQQGRAALMARVESMRRLQVARLLAARDHLGTAQARGLAPTIADDLRSSSPHSATGAIVSILRDMDLETARAPFHQLGRRAAQGFAVAAAVVTTLTSIGGINQSAAGLAELFNTTWAPHTHHVGLSLMQALAGVINAPQLVIGAQMTYDAALGAACGVLAIVGGLWGAMWTGTFETDDLPMWLTASRIATTLVAGLWLSTYWSTPSVLSINLSYAPWLTQETVWLWLTISSTMLANACSYAWIAAAVHNHLARSFGTRESQTLAMGQAVLERAAKVIDGMTPAAYFAWLNHCAQTLPSGSALVLRSLLSDAALELVADDALGHQAQASDPDHALSAGWQALADELAALCNADAPAQAFDY